MKIHRVEIHNFRNFKHLDVYFGDTAVIVGENKVGKSNFLCALRLVLDPSLPDTVRHLHDSDFWDGLPRPLTKDDKITISIELTDFEQDDDLMAVIGEHLVNPEPMISRLTYVFQPKATISGNPESEADYEFFLFGGDRPENKVGSEIRRRIPVDVLPALRDAEGDLASWNRSPLKPLLENVSKDIDRQELLGIADKITEATNAVRDIDQMRDLADGINGRITEMVGSPQAIQTEFGFSPADPDRLIRAARLFIDNGRRGVGDASLGTANLLYLTLKTLELRQLVDLGYRDYTLLAIEEPEAHLHPHLQRLVYRDFLKTRLNPADADDELEQLNPKQTILLTTHSPHIASVSPLRSLVLFKRTIDNATMGVSTSTIELTDREVADLERYLDVTRGELLFAKGVILVEGDAELFLIPEFGKMMGCDFDKLGITVCSVSGTNFMPYVKLLNSKGLGIPFSVITDLDPQPEGHCLGHTRVTKLLSEIIDTEEIPDPDNPEFLRIAQENGIFLNSSTLEIDLYRSGLHESMCRTVFELTENNAAKGRARTWARDPETVDEVRFLKDINEIGKGRFAQRLSYYLNGEIQVPDYIKEAINYVASRCG